jgi:hypothetical protein
MEMDRTKRGGERGTLILALFAFSMVKSNSSLMYVLNSGSIQLNWNLGNHQPINWRAGEFTSPVVGVGVAVWLWVM